VTLSGLALGETDRMKDLEKALRAAMVIVKHEESGRMHLAAFWDGNKYVQCRGDQNGGVRCEAGGALMQPSLAEVLTPDRVGRLSAMGWALDPSFGNYVRIFRRNASAKHIAAQMLAVLNIYEANVEKLLAAVLFTARYDCPPRNGPSQPLAGMINPEPLSVAVVLRACAYDPQKNQPLHRFGPRSTAADLIDYYAPVMAHELRRLRENKERRVYAIFGTDRGYVQCQPVIEFDGFLCEAQSAQSWPALAATLTPERVARLHAAGFSDPDSNPNYYRTYPFHTFDDAGLAAALLTVLYEVYGYRGIEGITLQREGRESGVEKPDPQ